jgi:LmbE family N-acetylglucosaminyl deacetylase
MWMQLENTAFAAEQTEKRRVFLTQSLAANTQLTDAQKADLIAFHENQWKENEATRETRYQESVAFFQKIAADNSLTQEQKKAAIKAHRDEAKAAARAHLEQQKAENKAKRDSLKQP